MKKRILIVDDEASQRDVIEGILSISGYEVSSAPDGQKALELIEKGYDLILTDIRMPNLDGLSLLKRVKEGYPHLSVIVMTAYGSISNAVEAMNLGATDYLEKPFTKDKLLLTIGKGLKATEIQLENISLHKQLEEKFCCGSLIGKSKAMLDIYRTIEKVLDHDVSVLITGESGTGKEVVAKTIHYEGKRKKKGFVAANCAAIPENLLESEFFGYEKGAFTGAAQTTPGLFEIADQGTLFLDEIGTLRIDLQAKLLRAIQEREIMHIGGKKPIKIDVRIISATSTDLERGIKEGRFREDLYYRLNVIPIHLPPLRERKEDIPLFIKHFIEHYAFKNRSPEFKVSPNLLRIMVDYPWQGNVRQLENTIERMLVLADGNMLTESDFPLQSSTSTPISSTNKDISIPEHGIDIVALERNLIKDAMEKSKGKIANAAKLLGLSYKTLQYRLKKFNLEDYKGKT